MPKLGHEVDHRKCKGPSCIAYIHAFIVILQNNGSKKETTDELLNKRQAGQVYTNELLKARMELGSSSKVCNTVHLRGCTREHHLGPKRTCTTLL